MDYDEACCMHLTPGVVHNFPKAVGVYDFCPLCTKISQIPIRKEKGATSGILVSCLNNLVQNVDDHRGQQPILCVFEFIALKRSTYLLGITITQTVWTVLDGGGWWR